MRRRQLLLPLLISAVLCAGAAPASATITVAGPDTEGGQVRVTGTPGADTVDIRLSGGQLRVSDASGVALVPSALLSSACTIHDLTEVRCTTWSAPRVELGGGDDAFHAAIGEYGYGASVDGGAGDDSFEIGDAPGTTIDGGAGTDTVTYREYDRQSKLYVTLRADASPGAPARVEAVEGSDGADQLLGSGAAETLRGGGGNDLIQGGGGVDALDGGAADDTLYDIDGSVDTIACGDGTDVASVDASDQHDGLCETRQGPGILPPGAVTVSPTVTVPRSVPATRTRTTRTTVKAGKSPVTVVSGPAADGGNTRVGARVRARAAGTVRLVVDHGEREIGRAEATVDSAREAVLNVPLDAEVRQLVSRTRHVELDVLVETEYGTGTPVAEQRHVTLVSPPTFSRGARGVTRRGGFGAERIRGTGRGDVLSGASGDDVLTGLTGNDRLEGGTGNDTLVGSGGNDQLDGFDGDDDLRGGAGDDLIIETRFGDDTIDGGAGDDWIVGGRGGDTIKGGPGDDVIFGGSAPDTIDCGAGDDTVFVNLESEKQTLSGCETVLEEDDVPSIRCDEGEGTDNGETMLGSDGEDVCHGHGGDDDVEGAGGHDKLFGGAGDDRIFGRFGDDELVGEAGNDEIEGGRGEDMLSGGDGNDQLNGGYGDDRVSGGAGNDVIIARSGGRDVIDCGPGKDVVIADRSDAVRGCETIRRK